MLIDIAGLPVFLFACSLVGLVIVLVVMGNLFSPRRATSVKSMPYESGMDPIHDARRRFEVRFHLVAIAFLVFDVELLFLYPWAVSFRGLPEPEPQAAAVAALRTAGGTPDGAVGADEATPPGSVPASVPAGARPERPPYLAVGGLLFLALLAVGYVYDWRRGVFQWR